MERDLEITRFSKLQYSSAIEFHFKKDKMSKYGNTVDIILVLCLYSIMFCGNAAGTFLSPMTIYKAENLYEKWVVGGPDQVELV